MDFEKYNPINPARSEVKPHAYRALTISLIDTNGYMPSQSDHDKERRAANPTIMARPLVRNEAGWIMFVNDSEAVAKFIRTKRITRCPTSEADLGETRR